MKSIVKKLERFWGRGGPRPFAHVPDDELLAALERIRRGQPCGITVFPGDPSAWPPSGFEHLSDAEITDRLQAVTRRLRTPHHRE